MAIANLSPESFSGDLSSAGELDTILQTAIDNGAAVLDVGGQSLRTDQPEMPEADELQRLVANEAFLLRAREHLQLSIDSYRPSVVRTALEMGFAMVNDPSHQLDPEITEACVTHGADLVVTYNIARPKIRLEPGQYVSNVLDACVAYFDETIFELIGRGLDPGRIVLDPGVDLGKSPSQSVELIVNAAALQERFVDHRFLWALSRKDFVGAIVGRAPLERDAGTLGAMAEIPFRETDLVRVHNVAAVADFFRMRAAIWSGGAGIGELDRSLRHGSALTG
jgi:dihydropteroate synthase